MFDVIIKNGLIVDGTGRPGFTADIGIDGDRIVEIGELGPSSARVIDAEGCVVAPGFIDCHSHTDQSVLLNPSCESKVTQGVTTEISGNCGESPASRSDRYAVEDEYADEFAEYGVDSNWHSMADYLFRLDALPMAINYATLVGHGAIRIAAMGRSGRQPSEDELAQMERMVEQSLLAGAFGLSSGLVYPPGCYADTDELIHLCRVAARNGGIYTTHMRNEGVDLIPALEEAIRIGREAGIGVQISHHKACGRNSWGRVVDSLALIDSAREQGLDIWADQYPYTATATGLESLLPDWAHDGGNSALVRRLTDPRDHQRLRDELIKNTGDGWIGDWGGWDSVVISFVKRDANRRYEGMSITAIASEQGRHPVDTVLDLLIDENGSVGVQHFAISPDDIVTVMRHPSTLIGSDATARSTSGPMSTGKPHPRAFGTFPRVLGTYVREQGVISLEEAVAKMTGRTAARFGLRGRGVLSEGNYADITIFDPDTIADAATYETPHALARGIEYVLVNGVVVLDSGRLVDLGMIKSGRVLRRGIN